MLIYWFLIIIGAIMIASSLITIYKVKNPNDFILFTGLFFGVTLLLSGIILECGMVQVKTPSILYILFIISWYPLLDTIKVIIEEYKYKKEEKRIQKQHDKYLKEQQREKELNKIIMNFKIKLYL